MSRADLDRPTGDRNDFTREVAMTNAAGQAFVLTAALFMLSFIVVIAVWYADRWWWGRRGPRWKIMPKGPDTNRR